MSQDTSQGTSQTNSTQGQAPKDEMAIDSTIDSTKDKTVIGSTTDSKTDDKTNAKDDDLKVDTSLMVSGLPEYTQFPYKQSSDKFLLMASVKAPHYRESKRSPIDLVCVVDESSSMGGEPIKLVKETVEFIVKNLEHKDRFGCIGYGSSSREIFPLTVMDDKGKAKAIELIKNIRASGSTALCAGLLHGLNMLRERDIKNDVSSVMLFTDGEANIGPSDAASIIKATINKESAKDVLTNRPTSSNSDRKEKPAKEPDNEQKQPDNEQKQPNDNDNLLPGTINTFGFGPNHKASLLQAIAEHGRGMYAFIEKVDMIADIFAECLGGLLSVVAQNIQLSVERIGQVKVNSCLSQGLNLKVDKKDEKYTVLFNDLQSEENRDIVFELTVPSIAEKNSKYPIVQISVQYKNLSNNENEVKSTTCEINRIDGNDIGEREEKLDLQVNRILAANAMNAADVLAQNGKLDDARKTLESAIQTIGTSKTAKETYSVNLVKDINNVKSNLRDVNQYNQIGSKMLKMKKEVHKNQRSVQSKDVDSDEDDVENAYTNNAKQMMKKAFKK